MHYDRFHGTWHRYYGFSDEDGQPIPATEARRLVLTTLGSTHDAGCAGCFLAALADQVAPDLLWEHVIHIAKQ